MKNIILIAKDFQQKGDFASLNTELSPMPVEIQKFEAEHFNVQKLREVKPTPFSGSSPFFEGWYSYLNLWLLIFYDWFSARFFGDYTGMIPS